LSDAGPAPPDGEMSFEPMVDDEESDVVGEVAAVLADEALWAGEEAAVDDAAAVETAECTVLGHDGSAPGGSALLGGSAFLAAPSELELLVLGLLVLGDVVGVVVGVTLGETLGLTDGLGLVLALAEALALALAEVLVLLWLPLGDVGGAAAVVVVLLAGLVVVVLTAACVDDDTQGLGEVILATPGLLDPGPSAVVGWGPAVPPPSVVPPAAEELLLLLPVMAELSASPTETVHWRAGGTAARTTPTANTAMPVAKAGRSIAWRQSRCRRGAGFCAAGRPSRPGTSRRASPAAKPGIASQSLSALLGWLARPGRDRIFSRIRSRPSTPGSTCSAAAWSSRRKNSAKSFPCPPSNPPPDLTMTPVPVPRAARPCRVRCDS
jgi:hypothetical protein